MSDVQVAVTLDVFDGQDACPVRKLILHTGVKEPIGRSAAERGSRDRPVPAIDNAFFDSPVISRQHAQLILNPDLSVSIVDVGSLHGTHVNSSKLKAWETRRLNNGDVITVGGTVVTNERSFPARKFKIIYRSLPNVPSVQRKEPAQDQPTAPKATARTSSDPTLLDPQQSTTFVVPESSSEDCNDICSCHESFDLDEDDLQIIDELSSSPVSKTKSSNATTMLNSSTFNKSNNSGPVFSRGQNLAESHSKIINLTEPEVEDDEQDTGYVIEVTNEKSSSIDVLSHMSDAVGDRDNEEDAEDSDLDADYHPIDDSSSVCSVFGSSPKSDIVDKTLPVPDAAETTVSVTQPAESAIRSKSLLAENQLWDHVPRTSGFLDLIASAPCNPASETRFNQSFEEYYRSPRLVEPFFFPNRRNSETLVPPLQPEYHSYYPVSGISQDPYFRPAQFDMGSKPRVDSRDSDPRYAKWRCTRQVPEPRRQTNGKRSTVATVAQTSTFHADDKREGNNLTEPLDKAVPEIQGSDETNQLSPDHNLSTAQETNSKKRKADEISKECHQLHSDQAPGIAKHAVTNSDGACKPQDKIELPTDTSSTQHATDRNNEDASDAAAAPTTVDPSVAFLGNSASATVPTTNGPLIVDERPTKRRRVNESLTVSEQRPRYQTKAKSSLTTFALGAVLGGVVGGISVMGALISLPDSLF